VLSTGKVKEGKGCVKTDIHADVSPTFTFPPARFALEAANNCQSHLESVHKVPITAGWQEAKWIPKLVQGFRMACDGDRNHDLSLTVPSP
jgi:hypothetical protein